MSVEFSSLNPYDSLEVIIADSPQALVELLKKNKTPIKIVSFVQVGNRSAAYVMGDIRIKTAKTKTNEGIANGSNSKTKTAGT